MTQTDVMSPDILSLQTFCHHGCFVPRMLQYVTGYFVPTDVLSAGRFVPPDVLSRRMFCPSGCFVPPDVLSLRTFCPSGRFVPVCYVSGCYVSVRFFSGHLKLIYIVYSLYCM
jgi:hypothetical protein